MQSLIVGIWNKSQETSTYKTNTGGRTYNVKAPNKPITPTYPYVVFKIINNSFRPTFREEVDSVLVQFTIHSKSSKPDEAGTILENLKDLYDDCILTVSGSVFHAMVREFTVGPHWFEELGEFRYVVQYRISMGSN